jgi:hypothetical protein
MNPHKPRSERRADWLRREKSRSRLQDRIRSSEFRVLPPQPLQLRGLMRSDPWTSPSIRLSAANPTLKCVHRNMSQHATCRTAPDWDSSDTSKRRSKYIRTARSIVSLSYLDFMTLILPV